MEFLDEDPRQRFFVQSRPTPPSSSPPSDTQKRSKPFLILCIFLSLSLFLLSLFLLHSQTLHFLICWLASSLLLAPFAPPSRTGGDIRVGHGPTLHFLDQTQPQEEPPKNTSNRRSRLKSENLGFSADPSPNPSNFIADSENDEKQKHTPSSFNLQEEHYDEEDDDGGEERGWTDEEFDMLKKQMAKHPVGRPRRWETIAEAFKGRHKVESVISMAKALAEKRPGDSYAQFLKKRKPLDKRVVEEDGSNGVVENGGGDVKVWTSGEDIALLNALKVFPKDAAMRWEKIAAAVPGRSKAVCMKRVGELKKNFRSSKASAET